MLQARQLTGALIRFRPRWEVRMRYLGSGFARVLAWMILAIFSLGVVGSVLAGGAELENQAAERNTVDALKSCWLKLVAGMSESEACFPVRDDLRKKFIGLAESWRKDPGFRAAELEIRSIERRDKTRTDLLLFGDSGGKPIGRPITFSIEPRAGVPTIVSMNDSPFNAADYSDRQHCVYTAL